MVDYIIAVQAWKSIKQNFLPKVVINTGLFPVVSNTIDLKIFLV